LRGGAEICFTARSNGRRLTIDWGNGGDLFVTTYERQ
jgi:hypothetical protein